MYCENFVHLRSKISSAEEGGVERGNKNECRIPYFGGFFFFLTRVPFLTVKYVP